MGYGRVSHTNVTVRPVNNPPLGGVAGVCVCGGGGGEWGVQGYLVCRICGAGVCAVRMKQCIKAKSALEEKISSLRHSDCR